MKLKSILKVSSAIRVEIYEPDENGLFDYDVDLLRHSEDCFEYRGGIRTNRFSKVPDRVMNYEVEMISTNTVTGALSIWTKK